MTKQGISPTDIRINATCGPESRADAIFAVNAISPNNVAPRTISSSARCVAFFGTVTRPGGYQMDVRYRDAVPSDASDIVDFQLAMARETEDFALDPVVCRRGVEAVFDRPSLGRYF